MEEKEIIKELFKDIYNIQIRYLYIPLDDFLMEHFERELVELRNKFKVHGEAIDYLCRGLCGALVVYKKRKETENDKKVQENK